MKINFHLRSPGFEVHIITSYFPTELVGNDRNIRRHGWAWNQIQRYNYKKLFIFVNRTGSPWTTHALIVFALKILIIRIGITELIHWVCLFSPSMLRAKTSHHHVTSRLQQGTWYDFANSWGRPINRYKLQFYRQNLIWLSLE